MESPYYDKSIIENTIENNQHRNFIGGLWDELGNLQIDFLKAHGLKPEHTLLDIGCGCLRLGVLAVDYLDNGNYWGTDLNNELLDAGYSTELAALNLQSKLPRSNLVCDREFEFQDVTRKIDFAIAQSLFTHLTLNHIKLCLKKLARHIDGKCIFYATFFIVDDVEVDGAVTHDVGEITTYPNKDPYHYTLEDIKYAAASTSWEVKYIGDWKHPRDQRMVAFYKAS